MTKGKLNIPTKQTIPEKRQMPAGAATKSPLTKFNPFPGQGNSIRQGLQSSYRRQINNLVL